MHFFSNKHSSLPLKCTLGEMNSCSVSMEHRDQLKHWFLRNTQQIDNNKAEASRRNFDLVGRFLSGFEGKVKKHVGEMKQQEAHLHPQELKSPPSGIRELYPHPQPAQPPCKGLFLKMLVEEASAVATELLFGSQGWIPVSDVIHSLIS